VKAETNELETNSEDKNVSDLHKGMTGLNLEQEQLLNVHV
jgi:hypothetical protein